MGDLDSILPILQEAQEFLREQGSPQWQNGYGPNREMIEQDILRQEGYVFLLEGEIFGYGALTQGEDESYSTITQGQWDSTHPRYLSIHRVAISSKVRGKGLARQMMEHLVATAQRMGYRDIRVDTYPRNQIMERVILGAGFTWMGMITLPIPDGERKAYQLIIPE
jgi:ribosomal protein S18 acetylase RimI-like enzyme